MSRKVLALLILVSCIAVDSFGQSTKSRIRAFSRTIDVKGQIESTTTIPKLLLIDTSPGEANREIKLDAGNLYIQTATAANNTGVTINAAFDIATVGDGNFKGGQVEVGVNDTTRGLMQLYGNATTTSGALAIHKGGTDSGPPAININSSDGTTLNITALDNSTDLTLKLSNTGTQDFDLEVGGGGLFTLSDTTAQLILRDDAGDKAELFVDTLGSLKITTTSSGAGGDFIISTPSITTALFINDSLGAVGFGTNLPTHLVHIKGTGTTNGLAIENAQGGGTEDPIIRFVLDGSAQYVIGVDNSDDDKFKIGGPLGVDDQNYFTIAPNGNVGINDSDPSAKFTVNGNTELTGALSVSGDFGLPGDPDLVFMSVGNFKVNGILEIFDPSVGLLTVQADGDPKFGIRATATAFEFEGAGVDFMVVDANDLDVHIVGGDFDVGTSILFVDSTNNLVGIGTINPDSNTPLHIVVPAGQGNGVLAENTDPTNPEVYYALQTTVTGINAWRMGINQDNKLSFTFENQASQMTGAGTKMLIDTSGNVGIGTTSPGANLEISRAGEVDLKLTDSTAVESISIIMRASDGNAVFSRSGTGSDDIAIESTGDVILAPGSGKVGIGTTSPGSKLSVDGTVTFNVDGGDFPFHVVGDTITHLLFADTSTDNVGIGTSGPIARLHVSGGVFLMGQGTLGADDVTPDVSGGNVFTTQANAGATTLTDLDNPTVGQLIYLIGGSDTNSTVVPSSGFFHLSTGPDFTLSFRDSITLFVRADDDYLEISRSNN